MSEPRVLALTGRKGSGKDEAAKALIEDGWVRVAFADPVRELLSILNPYVEHDPSLADGRRWNEILQAEAYDGLKQYPEARRLMQVFATEVVRDHFGADAWLDMGVRKVEEITDDGYSVVITDCRFPNEARKVRGLLAGRVAAIHRPEPLRGILNTPGILTPVDTHASETPLPEDLVDVHLTNSGSIADLHAAIRKAATA